MGSTVLDAGVLIALLDGADAHHASARAALSAAIGRGDALVLPASAYAEAMVRPVRAGPDVAAGIDALLDRVPIRVEPLTRAIALRAARIRDPGPHAVRLPDALVIAHAETAGAERLLTTDRRLASSLVEVVVITG